MVRIPLFVRVLIPLLAILMGVGGGTVYMTRAISTGYDCLQNDGWIIDTQHTLRFTPWTYGRYYGQDQWISRGLRVPQPVYLGPAAFSWTTHGKRTAHLDYYVSDDNGGLAEAWVSIDSPSEGIHLKLRTGVTSYPYQVPYPGPEFLWSGQGYSFPNRQLSWSPDGRIVLFQAYDIPKAAGTWLFSLFGIDGSSRINLAAIKQDPTTLSLSRVVWSDDSRFLVFPQGPITTESWAYDTVTKRYYLVAGATSNVPTPNSRIALPQKHDGKTTISLMDLNGANATPFVENADDAGEPSWSPDGNYVAIVWATGKGDKRVVRLSWTDMNGTKVRTLDDRYWDIHDLRWLSDGSSLAYIAQRNNGASVEIIDVGIGAARPLSPAYKEIAQLEENPTSNTLTYWWQNSPWQTGIDTYQLSGQMVYHRTLTQIIEGLELFRSAYRWIASPEVFRSPDGQVYAIRDSPVITSTVLPGLEMIAADGSWSKLIQRSTPGGPPYYQISAPLWSPDSKTLAFGSIVGYNSSLTVLRADGTRISDIPSSFETRGLSWTQCN